MKKSLFMMGVAIAALSSCTQNEVLDIAESNTIQFGKSYIGKPTRANIINNEDELDNFYVYGFTKKLVVVGVMEQKQVAMVYTFLKMKKYIKTVVFGNMIISKSIKKIIHILLRHIQMEVILL